MVICWYLTRKNSEVNNEELVFQGEFYSQHIRSKFDWNEKRRGFETVTRGRIWMFETTPMVWVENVSY